MSIFLKTYQFILFVSSLLILSASYGQSRFVDTIIPPSSDTICFNKDVLPFSFTIIESGTGNNDDLLIYENNNSSVCIKPHQKPIRVQYRELTNHYQKPYYHRHDSLIIDIDSITEADSLWQSSSFMATTKKEDQSNVSITGSISRSVSVGNNQGTAMNSSMNIEMDGLVTENISILASIADQQMPLQPEGNSQNINEFDKVFIKLYDQKKNHLIMGDYDLTRRDGGLLQYKKKLQGASFFINSSLKDSTKLSSTTSIALAKGRYCSKDIAVIEGSNGPYRLLGCKGELYIMIIAGSEKVYLDGVLMKRGEENDYTINYNTAEITFSYKHLLSTEHRIRVEYEYTDQNYTRMFLGNTTRLQKGNDWIEFALYSEHDNKNQPLHLQLSDSQKKQLQNAGDAELYSNAFTYDSIFDPEKIYYKKVDSIHEQNPYNDILVYSKNSDDSLYTAMFQYVGLGNGEYTIDSSLANGRIFRWSPPLPDGSLQGDYSPQRIIHAPTLKQVLSLSGEKEIVKNLIFSFDAAFSRNDDNLFASIDKEDDNGFALEGMLLKRFCIDSVKTVEFWAKSRFVHKQFSPVEDYNPREFNRNWNLDQQKANEVLLTSGARFFTKRNKWSLLYESLERKELTQGNRYTALGSYFIKKVYHNYNVSLMQSEGETFNSTFIKAKSKIQIPVLKQVTGYLLQTEQNTWNDSLNRQTIQSKSFISHKAFIQSRDTALFTYNLSATKREDFHTPATNNSFIPEYTTNDFSALLNKKWGQNSFSLSVLYRQKEYLGYDSIIKPFDENIRNRFEHSFTAKSKLLRTKTIYELGTGQERIISYQHIKVDDGQGTYMWNSETDYNQNGIPELNEFEIPMYQAQANYIRLATPTNEYYTVIGNTFNFSGSVDLFHLKYKKKKEKRIPFINRFSTAFTANTNVKLKDADIIQSLIPSSSSFKDTTIFSGKQFLRNLMHFNKRGKKLRINLLTVSDQTKMQTINGYEIKSKRENRIMIYLRLSSALFLRNYLTASIEELDAEAKFMQNREYSINSKAITPKLEWQPGVKWKLILAGEYKSKINNAEIIDYATVSKISSEVRANLKNKMHIRLLLDFAQVTYTGDANTALAYTMLETLRPGDNILWRTTINRQLMKNLFMQFRYEGRWSNDRTAIHSGTFQLRAVL